MKPPPEGGPKLKRTASPCFMLTAGNKAPETLVKEMKMNGRTNKNEIVRSPSTCVYFHLSKL